MTAITRTAYPQFKTNLSAKELAEAYTPTAAEIELAHQVALGDGPILSFMLLLKCFQRLGYFPNLASVPERIKKHIRSCLALPQSALPEPTPKTKTSNSIYRYHAAIRAYLKVSLYDDTAQELARATAHKVAQTRNDPADIINAVIERLVKERYQLPAFSTLELLVQQVTSQVNQALYEQVSAALPPNLKKQLENLLGETDQPQVSGWQRLKTVPKSATLAHLKELQAHYQWLLSLGDVAPYLAQLNLNKRQELAAYAKSLKASELGEMLQNKRYTLLVCLISSAQSTTRDNLVETFLKRLAYLHNQAKAELEVRREQQRSRLERLLVILNAILLQASQTADATTLGTLLQQTLALYGGAKSLLGECEELSWLSGNNYYPLLDRYYKSHRHSLFELVKSLQFVATSQDDNLLKAVAWLLKHQNSRQAYLTTDLSLDFVGPVWRKLIFETQPGGTVVVVRRQFEICLFSLLASELKSGDIAVRGASQFADYREQLLSWDECAPLLAEFCEQSGLPPTASGLVERLKTELTTIATSVDQTFTETNAFELNAQGQPRLKKTAARPAPKNLAALEAAVREAMPVRSVLEILTNLHYYTGFTRHFAPLSGSDPKLDNPLERYLLATFSYGCNLGPAQTARHLNHAIQPQQIAWVNHRHIDQDKLEAARTDIINGYAAFELPKRWGDGSRAGADGTKFELNANNLVSEYHIRYGGFGGIAYQYVSDSYIALFSRFITCGVWEGSYILDLFCKNRSAIQPDTIHADTQGQSTPIFGLAYLLGVQLMPRIRNLHDLVFYRPTPGTKYQHLEALFSDKLDWELIERHWQDLLRVAISIRQGKILPSTLLRKLTNYSHKNKLYQAMQELGRAVRTTFLLKYLSDSELRRLITAMTNKVEAFNRFSKWFFFGSEATFTDNNPLEQQKRLQYLHLVANAAIYQNVVDMSRVLATLAAKGLEFGEEELACLSPYLTYHIKRFGDYQLNLASQPEPFDGALTLTNSTDTSKIGS